MACCIICHEAVTYNGNIRPPAPDTPRLVLMMSVHGVVSFASSEILPMCVERSRGPATVFYCHQALLELS